MTTPARLAKLIARLNTKAANMDPGRGRGGIPSLTPQDVAAALGAAASRSFRDSLAVDVLCLRHWPDLFDGAEVTSEGRYREVKHWHRDTFGRRVAQVERIPIPQRAPNKALRRLVYLMALRCARDFYKRHKTDEPMRQEFAKRMPIHPKFWLKMALAIVTEYRSPNYCQTCKGNETIRLLVDDPAARNKVKLVEEMCPACMGSGVAAWSYKRRAKSLHIRAETYRNYIQPIHEREIALLRALELRAAWSVMAKLG